VTAVDAQRDVSATGGSARSQAHDLRERSWRPRPILSFAIMAVAFLLPMVAAVTAVQVVARLVRRPDAVTVLVMWFCGLVAVASGTLWAVNLAAKRLLPIATMLRFSLVFPDSAPSRFSMALRTGSGRALQRALQQGTTTTVEYSTSRDSASLVVGLIAAVSAHDRLTRGHSERVRAYADLIGEELGLDAEDRNKLHWAALLHDVGKLAVPAAILNKSERLTAEEWEIIRRHPAESAPYLEPVRAWLGDWALAASQHHERYDGQGYPDGLKGDDISLAGRIVAVADAFDVMTSTRSYKKPLPAAQARAELAHNAGTQFDPKIVRAFLAISLGKVRVVAGPLAGLSALSGLISVGGIASGAAAAVATTAVAASALTVAPPPAHAAAHPTRAATTTTEVAISATTPPSTVGHGRVRAVTATGRLVSAPTTVPRSEKSPSTRCAALPATAAHQPRRTAKSLAPTVGVPTAKPVCAPSENAAAPVMKKPASVPVQRHGHAMPRKQTNKAPGHGPAYAKSPHPAKGQPSPKPKPAKTVKTTNAKQPAPATKKRKRKTDKP
jgi:HD-GYP domain-containing protein (c-di-GMP phosphodiesterase class II)